MARDCRCHRERRMNNMATAPGTPIARRRTALLCLRDNCVLCIELRDPVTLKRFWSLPGGEIEPGESAADAAARETLEETGYTARVQPDPVIIHRYLFRWAGKVYDCETCAFLGEVTSPVPAKVDDADYLLGCRWIPASRLAGLMADHPDILEIAQTLLGSARSRPRAGPGIH